MLGYALTVVLSVGADPGAAPSLDDAPDAVRAYLSTAEAQRESRAAGARYRIEKISTSKAKSLAKTAAQDKKERIAEMRALREFIKRVDDPREFTPAISASDAVANGYCGRLARNYTAGLTFEPAGGRVVQVIDGTTAIVRAGEWYWVSGISTAGIADDQHFEFYGAWFSPGTKTYESVGGGQRTVRELVRFNERDALPYLPERQRKSLERLLDGETAPPSNGSAPR